MFHTWIAVTPASDARNTQSHHCQSLIHAQPTPTMSASAAVSTRGKSHPRIYQCGWLLKLISVPLTSHTPASASVHCRISNDTLPLPYVLSFGRTRPHRGLVYLHAPAWPRRQHELAVLDNRR